MSNILVTGKVTEGGNILTPKGRLVVFGNALFEPQLPKGETDEKKASYQATLLLPAAADLTILKKAVKDRAVDEFSEEKRKKLKLPFLATEDQERFAELAEEFPTMVRCSAKFKPDVVSPKGDRTVQEDEAPDEVYSGRWARLSVRVYTWSHPTGGPGVSLGLGNVQLLDHDEQIAVGGGVRGIDEFEGVGDVGDFESGGGGDPLTELE